MLGADNNNNNAHEERIDVSVEGMQVTAYYASNHNEGSRMRRHVGKEIDASINTWCWVACLPCTFGALPYKTTLTLEDQEVIKTDVDLCGVRTTRRLYRDLGNIDRSSCLCWINAEFTTTSVTGGSTGGGSISVSPGCGCDRRRVDDIIDELRSRTLEHCEDSSIMRRNAHALYDQDKPTMDHVTISEATIDRLNQVDSKLDAIMHNLQIPKMKHMTERDEHTPV